MLAAPQTRLSYAGHHVWCMDSTGWSPVNSQKRCMWSLFSGLKPSSWHLKARGRGTRGALKLYLAALARAEADLRCGSFFGWVKPGSQSLAHRKSVRTIEVTLGRSASWQVDLHRQHHQVVVGDVEEAAVQWETKVEMAVRQLQHHLPFRLGEPTGLLC